MAAASGPGINISCLEYHFSQLNLITTVGGGRRPAAEIMPGPSSFYWIWNWVNIFNNIKLWLLYSNVLSLEKIKQVPLMSHFNVVTTSGQIFHLSWLQVKVSQCFQMRSRGWLITLKCCFPDLFLLCELVVWFGFFNHPAFLSWFLRFFPLKPLPIWQEHFL